MNKEKKWNVYCAYSHKLVTQTNNIKEFLSNIEGMSSNAHIQIYKTNTINDDTQKPILPTYKGFFIRPANADEAVIPFPDKRFKDPEYYIMYRLEANGDITKLCKITNPQKELAKKGYSDSDIRNLLLTSRMSNKGTPLKKTVNGEYLRPYGDYVRKIPDPAPKKSRPPKEYAVFDEKLNIVSITTDLKGFSEECNKKHQAVTKTDEVLFKYFKPLYSTNQLSAHDKFKTKRPFYKGYAIRETEAILSGQFPPLPVPNSHNKDNDMLVWKKDNYNADGLIVGYVFCGDHMKTVGLDTVNPKNLLKKAKLFSKTGDFSEKDEFCCIFLKDYFDNLHGAQDITLDNDILLPESMLQI